MMTYKMELTVDDDMLDEMAVFSLQRFVHDREKEIHQLKEKKKELGKLQKHEKQDLKDIKKAQKAAYRVLEDFMLLSEVDGFKEEVKAEWKK